MTTRLQAIIDFVYRGDGVQQAQAALGRFQQVGKDVGQAWGAIATPLNQTIQIFQQVGQAAQQAYEYVGEGVQLARAEDQFMKLAGSIGTTADALMNQLRTATKGTVSDFALMEGASSLVNLGLTKTSEDTVRLTKLIGQLGWDMNQVTLTLANQSTMRLDALGLSVSDVEGRVDALKDSGLAADEAFKFAIIEAGEEKLRLLGDAAETAAGKLAILESNAANLKDNFQATFSEQLISGINDAAGGLFETAEGASAAGKSFGDLAADALLIGLHIKTAADSAEELEESLQGVTGQATQSADIMPKLNDAFMAQRQAIIDDTAAIDGWMASMNTVTTMTPQAIQQLHQQAAAIYQETSPAYAELQDKVYQTSQEYSMNIQKVRAANLANQQLANTVPTVTGAIYASSEAVSAYNAQLGEYYLAAQDTEDANMLLNSGIRETSGGLREVSNLTEAQTEDLERMQGAYDKAAQTIRDYELGVKGANLSDEERAEKIEELRGQMSLLEGNMNALNSAGSTWVEVAGGMVGFGPAVADAFTQSANAAGLNAEQIAGLQMAFGDLTPVQAETMLKEALLRGEIDRLTEAVKNKNMTIYEARDAYVAFQASLNDMSVAVNDSTGSVLLMDGSMVSAANSTQTLLDKFGAFPDEVGTTVNVDTTEAENRISSLEARLMGLGSGGQPGTASGGYQAPPDVGGPGFASGANFIVPPGYPNDSFPMRVQSGEHVTVTPAGQPRGGDTFNVYLTPANPDNVMSTIGYLKSLAGA